MDRVVTVRFYQIEHPNDGSPRVEQILRDIVSRPRRDREVGLDDGAVVLRLEELGDGGNILIGDLTRVQTRNLPGHVQDDDVARLPVDQIGHSAAFLFDVETNCLAMQFNMQMGVTRFSRYLRSFGHGADFGRLPYLKQDTLERFRHQTPTKLRLKVARVRNFRDVAEGKTEFEEQLEEWSRLFDAPSIEVILATRGEGNQLDDASVWNTVRRWMAFREQIGGIKNIEAETLESDKAFDFIKDLLEESETLNLPDNDPQSSREDRAAYVRRVYDQHRAYIRRISGVG